MSGNLSNKVDYSATERLNKIYSGLDYDVDAIKELEEVFAKLDVANAHKNVAFDLLRLLYDIGNYTQEVLNDQLRDTNLSRFMNYIDKPKEIGTKLYDFMKLRDEVIGEVKAQLKVAVTKKNDTANLITELKKINVVSNMTDIAKKVYLSLPEKQKEIANFLNK
ncbi:hypothetical protein DB313_04985 (plasmid) [Borrelia turcica IST7]|uniref:Uncharacterized protein n=2 Tax=Borrelia turcica TaxID=229155 RepID=A0A386PMR7_9SPIR|nr:hypothetical protein DB313_04985 [Borrelia turcica IST7]